MSVGGRWRLAMSVVRTLLFAALLGALGWGAWLIIAALQQKPERIPAAAKTVPMKPPVLQTTRDGVLDDAWLARTLELPKGISLVELDLKKLQDRVLADRQVLSATITRIFPDRLIVKVAERMPVARIRVERGDPPQLLVARDGVAFPGSGFDPAMIATLPWLGGIRLVPDGAWYKPVADMDVVARLIAEAQFSAPHQYHHWFSVSLARLQPDREIEVTLRNGSTGRFTAKESFFSQLAEFDYIIERAGHVRGFRVHADLTMGRDVPVWTEVDAPADAKTAGPSLFPLLSSQSSKSKREL
jgi:hypothetical protein